jgi:hypothetical protein
MNKFFKMSSLALFVALSSYAPVHAGGQSDIKLTSYEVLSAATIVEAFFYDLKENPLYDNIQVFPELCQYLKNISSEDYELNHDHVMGYVSIFQAIHKSMDVDFIQLKSLIQDQQSEVFLQKILAKMASKIINHKNDVALFSDQVAFLEKVLLYPFHDKAVRKSAADWFDQLSADINHQDDWKKESLKNIAMKFNFLQVLNPAKFAID